MHLHLISNALSLTTGINSLSTCTITRQLMYSICVHFPKRKWQLLFEQIYKIPFVKQMERESISPSVSHSISLSLTSALDGHIFSTV